MIDKLNLVNIISKYHLNGMVDMVRWNIKDGTIKIRFNAKTKDMIGEVEYNGFPLEDSTVAFSNTGQLLKLISITNGYLSLEYKKQHQLETKLIIADNQYTLDYTLAGLTIVPDPGRLTFDPNYTEFATIDNESINAIVKAKGALTDTDTVVIKPNPNADGEPRLELQFAGDIEHSNKVSFFLSNVELTHHDFLEHYNSNMIKEIMYCNKDMVECKMSMDLDGIMKLEFVGDNIKTVYHVVAKDVRKTN